jgi:DNA modification methylase
MSKAKKNALYYGDNLNVLRESIQDESVDLIYLDPPFNSARDYNILFSSPKGGSSEAQITAFEDSWHWGEQAEREFGEIVRGSNTDVSAMIQALRKFLGENDMMAYLTMMANRLLELHRVLKPTGSLYLHCDPTASHYLKIVLDGVFGKVGYRNEIIWQRTNSHNTAKQYGRVHDTIFFYCKSNSYVWNNIYAPYSEAQIKRYRKDSNGRLFTTQDLTASRPNSASGKFEWRGTMPSSGRGWGYTALQLESWWEEGKIACKKDGTPRMDGLIVYLDEKLGKTIQSVWTDVERISNTSSERLGYPTQKPLALLERIVEASSNEGDVILDPFCGCGTAVHAAQKLGRNWLGIDITHLAVSLIEMRLKNAFKGIAFDVHGVPKDLEGARDLALRDKYQFQWWACSLVNAQPYQGKKKGADGGIDGLIFFQDDGRAHKKIIVSVKGGENVSVAMVRDLAHVVKREEAEIGLFVTLTAPTKPMTTEAIKEGYYTNILTGNAYPKIQILTVEGLLKGTERALFPDLSQGATTFKKAKRDEKKKGQSALFN